MRWPTSALVAAFVAVDLAVLGGAYALTHRGPAASADPEGTPSSSASASSAAGTPDWTGPLLLAASDSGRLVRVTRGSCDPREPVRSRVWVASSERTPLRPVTVPGLQESLGARVDGDRISIVGTGPKCAVAGYLSTDDGRTWRRGGVPDDAWYLDRDTTAQLLHGPVPSGRQPLSCTPVSVTTLDDGAALVSCASDSVYRLRVGQRSQPGPEQTYPAQAPVAAAPGAGADGSPLALTALDGCPSALVRLSTAGSLQQLACLGRDAAPLGLATSRDRIYVQIGYRLLSSTDGGTRFTPYPGGTG